VKKARTGVDQTIQYPQTQSEDVQINRETELDLYYNSSGRIWHIFPHSHGNTKCLCGTKERDEFLRNHCRKKRPAEKTLQNPDPWLGNVCMHCRSKLADLIKDWDRQQAQQKTEVEA